MAMLAVNAFFDAARSHSSAVGSGALVIGIIAAEQFLIQETFSCPCYEEDLKVLDNPNGDYMVPPGRTFYGTCFLAMPFLALLCIGLAANGETKRCLTSSTQRRCDCGHQMRAISYFFSHALICMVPPAAWIIIATLDGRYLACTLSTCPTNCIPLPAVEEPVDPAMTYIIKSPYTDVNLTLDFSNIVAINQMNSQLVAISQVIGWTLIGFGAIMAILGVLFLFCCCSGDMTYYQRRFMEHVRNKEMEAFEKVSDELLTDELEKKWRTFFFQAKEGDWERVSHLATGEARLIGEKYYYTAFHQWEPEELPEKEETDGAQNGGHPVGYENPLLYPAQNGNPGYPMVPILYPPYMTDSKGTVTPSAIPLIPMNGYYSNEDKAERTKVRHVSSKTRSERESERDSTERSKKRDRKTKSREDEDDEDVPVRLTYLRSVPNKAFEESDEDRESARRSTRSRSGRLSPRRDREPTSRSWRKKNKISASDDDGNEYPTTRGRYS